MALNDSTTTEELGCLPAVLTVVTLSVKLSLSNNFLTPDHQC